MPVDREIADRNTLIREYMPMAAQVARKLAPRYLRDDLVAESYLILCHALNNHPRMHSARLRTYLYSAVRKGVLYAIRSSRKTEALPPLAVDGDFTTDVEEVIGLCCTTPMEHKIVAMRAEHYTLRDIATSIGWKYDRVRETLHRVRKRCLYRLYGTVSK